ncbi:alpha/beta-hydrolase [Cryphonectria parasitica EP155]|uniref:Carboxylic ester hydrolase n=1 Tax=Cryphonectria parasitica (strain ATCC 38755 / EP155) TaxID=660469 RepID=A0A9P4YAU4_CRYP1|nr:alpha/beta-hydrolase [Cryphonectria parasitica EP155]KAF3770199.1 alpha/beta-hydrolase [Cryphonectria parasitica EP155]
MAPSHSRYLLFLLPLLLLGSLTIATPSPRSLDSDLTILMNNDLQGISPYIDSAVILLSRPSSYQDAVEGCKALGETLWSPETVGASIQSSLDYLVWEGKADENTQFWVASSTSSSSSSSSTSTSTRAISASGKVSVVQSGHSLAALCTQSAPLATAEETSASSEWHVSVHSNNDHLIGFRDRTSFRFYGIRYADQPERFNYSQPYFGSNSTVSATAFGNVCAQITETGSEDCLFLNIWTPYLPGPSSQYVKANLKPVMFWIHGGAFVSGAGSDSTFDGGSLASRGDVVVVTINYRLSTLGFLALDDGSTNGNYGIADQITALDWVMAHIADFGGDADRITIFGQSAGAGSVRALMASPEAQGKFAGAIPQSNLGGLYYGTTYSEYYTIQQEMDAAGSEILAETGCADVDCLRQLDAFTLLNLATTAEYVVQDGVYITSDHLPLTGPAAPYKLLMGTMYDDGAAFITFPDTTNEAVYLEDIDFAPPRADLFPIPTDSTSANQTLDLFNMTARYATDAEFRCVDEATVYAGLANGLWDQVYYYEMQRSYQLYDWPNYDVCQPPITAAFPYGDPSGPYFKCHSGDLYEVFGNIAFQGLPFRDEWDLPFEQMVVDTWASFARTLDPNPDTGFLRARGYSNTSEVLQARGLWMPAEKGNLTMRALEWPPYQDKFREESQCSGIGLPFTYYQ